MTNQSQVKSQICLLAQQKQNNSNNTNNKITPYQYVYRRGEQKLRGVYGIQYSFTELCKKMRKVKGKQK